MDALKDNTAALESVASPTHPPASKLVATWARGRRQITPWAYPRLRALGALRLAIGIFLIGVGALLAAHGHAGWATVPFAGAALHLAIGGLDTTAARSVHSRS
jgi:hypothetical protein